jgi:hypothetical protein
MGINAAHRFYAAMSDKPDAQAAAESMCKPVPRERKAALRDPEKRYEADVLRDILKALRKHPKVARVERRQSGVFQDGGRFVRVGRRGDPDIGGILKGGRTLGIEVKRPGEVPSEIQWQRINEINAAGGLAGWADSVEMALALLD